MRKFFEVKSGSTRTALLIGNTVIKVPNPTSWMSFLWGCINNLYEQYIWKDFNKQDCLCPIIWAGIGGLFNVMPRCDLVPASVQFDAREWLRERKLDHVCEGHPDCFGMLNNKLVIVDYGTAYKRLK